MKNDFGGYDNKRDIISVIEFPDLYQKGKASSMRYFEKIFQTEFGITKAILIVIFEFTWA